MRHQWPILRTATAALGSFVAVALVHGEAALALTSSLSSLAWIVAGALYAHLVEHWCHRVPMHRGIRIIDDVRRNHLEHHSIFHGSNFQTRDPEDLDHIAGRYWVFPILFFAHYAAMVFVLPSTALVAFLFGAVVHYTLFEITHWLTHVEENAVDRWIARIPLLAKLRAAQIEHHRIHHETPVLAFNFNPPYLGDRVFGHMPPPASAPRGLPEVAAPAAPLVPASEPPAVVAASPWWRVPFVRYGSAAAVGVALVGAVVVAHGLWSHSKRSAPATTSQV